jgi:hypothetical protein
MYGSPLELTPLGDLLMWGGLASLSLLIAAALIVPRRWRASRESAEPQ